MNQETSDLKIRMDSLVDSISNNTVYDIKKIKRQYTEDFVKKLQAIDNLRTLMKTIHQLHLSNPKPIEYILENEEGTPLHTLLTLFVMIERFYNGDITDFIPSDQFFIRDLLLGKGQISGDNSPTIPL